MVPISKTFTCYYFYVFVHFKVILNPKSCCLCLLFAAYICLYDRHLAKRKRWWPFRYQHSDVTKYSRHKVSLCLISLIRV